MARPIKKSEIEPKIVNAIDLLQSQHREVEKLFAALEKTTDRAVKARTQTFAELKRKLSAHAEIEENLLYPAGRPIDKDLTLEAYEEHDIMKEMLTKIARTRPDDETFKAKVIVLKEVVEHHVKEEEKEFFPKLRRHLGKERLEEIGTEMAGQFDKLVMAPRRNGTMSKRHLTRVK
jgi:hemerythrin superfamily protein